MGRTTTSLIEIIREERTAWIYLNRPEKGNALNIQMLKEMIEALDTLERDQSIVSLVITGRGKLFCAGADLNEMKIDSILEMPLGGLYGKLFLKLLRFSKPTIAMVNGGAIAGGVGLVLASHLAIASKESYFSTPEINLGFFPYMVMSVLFKTVPRKIAFEMIFTGRRIDAEEALKYSLVNKVVEGEELLKETKNILSQINNKEMVSFIRGLEALSAIECMSLDQAVIFLQQQLRDNLMEDYAKERIEQFLSKR